MAARKTAMTLITLMALALPMATGPALCETARKDAAPQQSLREEEEKLPPVLPSEQFFGAAAMGYAACKAVPHICHKLFCYCGCDITDRHLNLLDCFTSLHGADCHICQEEALLALRMNRDGQSLGQIQKVIDEGYQSKYPFKEESPALKKYRASRLYTSLPAAAKVGADPSASAGACCPGK